MIIIIIITILYYYCDSRSCSRSHTMHFV